MIDRRLLYAVATARYGSFTIAAERVGVTQSAITKSVADLEADLGYLVFDRTARGVFLTEEGRAFIERAEPVLEDLQELFRGKPNAGANELLRIGVCPASAEWMLIDPLALLLDQNQNVRLCITGGGFDRTVQQLRIGAIDVAVGYKVAFDGHRDFRLEVLPSLETKLFVRKGHPILECDEITPSEIAKYDIISHSSLPSHDIVWRKIYEQAGFDAHEERIHVVDFFPIVTMMVLKTNAISAVATQYTETRYFQDRFACVPYRNSEIPPAPFCCATRIRRKPNPTVRAFIKACKVRFPTSVT